MVQLFAAVGFGQWLRFVTGALEVSGAMALLFPSTAALGAALLVVVMTGAVVANVTLLHTSPLVPFGLLIMVAIIAIGRHRRRHHIMRPALGHRAAMH
jgi:putative oxidoreductase